LGYTYDVENAGASKEDKMGLIEYILFNGTPFWTVRTISKLEFFDLLMEGEGKIDLVVP
jgi:hypothetical protein